MKNHRLAAGTQPIWNLGHPTLVALLTLAFSPAAWAQAMIETVHGDPKTCVDLSELDTAEKSQNKLYFQGWQDLDFQNERSLVDHCPRPLFHGKALHDARVAFLVGMQRHVEQDRQTETTAMIQRNAAQSQQREAQEGAKWQQLAQTHRNDFTGRKVRVAIVGPGRIDQPQPHFVTGDLIPAGYMNTILFTEEPCSLPIAGSQTMHRAWMALGAYQLGCWYSTVQGNYVVLDGRGDAYPSSLYWEALPLAALHSDGTATLTEPHYDSTTFMSEVSRRKLEETLQHRQELP